MSLQIDIHCGDTLSNTISGTVDEYRFAINNTFNVRFETCGSSGDVRINVYDNLDTIVSNPYCIGIYGDDDDSCGLCNDNNTKIAENFTIPNMVRSIYRITINPFIIGENPSYDLTVTCNNYANNTNAPNATNIYYTTTASNALYCGDTVYNTITEGQQQYGLIINNLATVTIDTCGSTGDVYIFVYDIVHNYMISDYYCLGGDYCGNCDYGEFTENFTIATMLPETYEIYITPYEAGKANNYTLSVSCSFLEGPATFDMDNLIDIQCGDRIYKSMNSTNQSHDFVFVNNQSHDVTFDTCGGPGDVDIDIYEEFIYIISDLYCTGVYCCYGRCTVASGNDNFTIPNLLPGVYGIKITADISRYANITFPNSYNLGVTCNKPPLFCGDFVSGRHNNQSHAYTFIIDHVADVTLDTCRTATDVVIWVYDEADKDISSKYCDGPYGAGDFCGTCSSDTYYPENFTIPNIAPGTYQIVIAPYQHGANSVYDLQIVCSMADTDPLQCGDTIFNTIHVADVRHEYLFVIKDKYNVTFDTCNDRYNGDAVVISLNGYNLSDNCSADAYDVEPETYRIVVNPSWSANTDYDIAYKLAITCSNPSLVLQCGDILSDVTMTADVDEYQFILDTPLDVMFDSCGSRNNVSLNVYHNAGLSVSKDWQCDGSAVNCGNCDAGFTIPYMFPSTYIIKVLPVDTNETIKYDLAVTCRDTQYVMTVGAYHTWHSANIACQRMFNATLATPKTETDWDRINWQFFEAYLINNYGEKSILGAWIGLHNDFSDGSGSKWQWADGSLCNSTDKGHCDSVSNSFPPLRRTSIPANQSQPLYALYSQSGESQPTIEYISENNDVLINHVDSAFNEAFICNGGPKYTPTCEEITDCWIAMNCCDDGQLFEDIQNSQNQNRAPMVYWNNTLFVIGWRKIHYTQYKLGMDMDSEHQWNASWYDFVSYRIVCPFNVDYTKVLNQTLTESSLRARFRQIDEDNIIDPFYDYWPVQQYAQYKSSLYLYYPVYYPMYNPATHEILHIVFLHIDLNTLNSTAIHTPQTDLDLIAEQQTVDDLDDKCLVADYKNVYVIGANEMEVYDIDAKQWDVRDIDLDIQEFMAMFFKYVLATCAITNDSKFIYLFYNVMFEYDDITGNAKLIEENFQRSQIWYNYVVKYDVNTGSSTTLSYQTPPSLWWTQSAHAVTAGNGKIYLHGCYISWQTAIFDPETDQFETETIDVNNADVVQLYDESRLAKYDDNVLLLLSIIDISQLNYYSVQNISLYATITDLVSINITETALISSVWPSDGFSIKYYLNDFSDTANGSYDVRFYVEPHVNNSNANNTIDIDAVITLNIFNDDCFCETNVNIYSSVKCSQCKQHFDLNKYSKAFDNDANKLDINIIAAEWHGVTPLIIPKYLSIALERCIISFENGGSISNTDTPITGFHYSLKTTNCYSRDGIEFSISVLSAKVNMEKELIISVNNRQSSGKVCDVENVCNSFDGNYFEIKHATLADDDRFAINFISNSIDLIIDDSSKSIPVPFNVVSSLSSLDIGLIVSGSVVAFICVLSIFGWQYKKIWDEKQRRKKYEHKIYNPMVVSLGIAFYDEEVENPGINVHCPNLDGVDRDYESIQKLCKLLNYDLYPKYEKYAWTEREMIEFLEERAADIGGDNKKQYDGILLVLSGHGFQNNIITSDYQMLSKTAVHRLFSTNYASVRLLPRMFIYDCCDGGQERSHYAADYNTDESDESDESDSEGVGDDAGKGITKKDEGTEGTEQGKNFVADDIKINQYDEELWKKDQKNPDYKLSLIHAANEGFKAKMNAENGSYLIYQFALRVIADIENDKKKEQLYVGEIIDGIQQYLHDSGKQQITAIFNNQTRYLKFEQNEEQGNKLHDIEDNEVIEVEDVVSGGDDGKKETHMIELQKIGVTENGIDVQ